MRIFKAIINLIKKIFGQDINIKCEKNNKYNVNKNKNCNISINDGGINERKK